MDASGPEAHAAGTSRFNQLRLLKGHPPGHEVSFYARVHEVLQRSSDEGVSGNTTVLLMREEAWFVDVEIDAGKVSGSAWATAETCTAESILHVVGRVSEPAPTLAKLRGLPGDKSLLPRVQASGIEMLASAVDNLVTIPGHDVARWSQEQGATTTTTATLTSFHSLSLHERLNNRILDVRVAATGAIFKLFSGMLGLASQHCLGRGMNWIQTPSLIGYKIPTDDDYFSVTYPGGMPCWLSQTVELHHEMALSMDFQRVFEIKHMFRAEKDVSPRRLSEVGGRLPIIQFTGLEISMVYETDWHEAAHEGEDMFIAVVRGLQASEKYSELIQMAKKLYFSAGDFKLGLDERGRLPRVNFVEAKQLLREHEGMQTDEDGDLTHEEEAKLGALLRRGVPLPSGVRQAPLAPTDAFFITDYPQRLRPPQTVPNDRNGPARPATDTWDLVARGREVASFLHFTGSAAALRAALRRDGGTGRDPDAAMWRPWLGAFEAGLLPHVNCAFGMNRVLQAFLGLGDVREATLFPRDAGRLAP
ncbi:aspartyl-tRNA synthetase [Apiospora aurea]|uniref:Aspartyl-tRNA synthetase n=1 Tax=Apiospora aurea TaxID=335848 RepID=A0ABR1PT86_9PEZI